MVILVQNEGPPHSIRIAACGDPGTNRACRSKVKEITEFMYENILLVTCVLFL